MKFWEFLVVVGFIAFFLTITFSERGIPNARVENARVLLNGIKVSVSQYNSFYGQIPSKLDDLLEESEFNRRNIKFFDGNMVPLDPLDNSQQIKMISNIASVEKDGDGNIISYIQKPDANGIIVYSVGLNEEDDGGIYLDPDKEYGKDDVSLFISLDKLVNRQHD